MLSKITVSPAPHISEKLSTRRVMLDVIIGLVPAIIAGGIFFRVRGLVVIGVCIAACMASEWICNRIRKKPNSLRDLSAIVTGIILALSLPPLVPLSVAIIGSVFCIVVVKMLFGGLGSNVFNPAMAARALECFGGRPGRTAAAPADQLSDRELEVLRLFGKGWSVEEIAQQLHLSAKTVDAHRGHIKTKLGCGTTPEFLRFAIAWVAAQERLVPESAARSLPRASQ